MKKERNSNLELMRIVSMLFIILWHIYYFGNIRDSGGRIANPTISFIFEVLPFILLIHVNSFALLTGYFYDEIKVKAKKVTSLFDSMIFYRIIVIISFTYLGIISLTKVDYISLEWLNSYWFVIVYIALYLLTPFLNKLIDHMTKKEFFHLLLVSLFILSFVPYITADKLVIRNDGYSLYNFILLYFMGAYIKKYPIRKNFMFSHMSDSLYRLVLIGIFILCVSFNFCLYKTINIYSNLNEITKWISENNNSIILNYSLPIIILQSVVYFLFFESLSFKSKFINRISKLTLGVYLIHEEKYIKQNIYTWLGITKGTVYSYKFLIYILGMTLLIFISCAIIEFIRQEIFKFIYNRKISKKINTKIKDCVSSIHLINEEEK